MAGHPRDVEKTPPHLLHFRISHYNEKVRWALDHKGWAHTRETVIPGFHVPRVRRLTGQNQVPVLVLDGHPLCDSSAILLEIERRRPDPPLLPADPAERARALAIEAYFDDEVAPDLRRLFWSAYLDWPADCARMAADGFGRATHLAWRAAFPIMLPAFRRNLGTDRDSVARARARLGAHWGRLEAELGPSGYLVGDRFTLADLTAAAVLSAILRPPEFPYPLPEPWPPGLVELQAEVADRPGTRWALGIYARHRGASAEIERSA